MKDQGCQRMWSFTVLHYFLDIQDNNLHAIDWDGLIPYENQSESVEVPTIECPISNEDYEEMVETIVPLSQSDEHAIDIYLQCISFVQSRMNV